MSLLGTAVQFQIARDPVTVTITRTVRARQGGGFTETTETSGPHTVTVAGGEGASRTLEVLGGAIRTEAGWFLLAPPEAVFKAGQEGVAESVDVPGYGSFRVTDVQAVRDHGVIHGWLATLDRRGA